MVHLAQHQLPLFFGDLDLVYIRAGAIPARDPSGLVAHRLGTPQHPPILPRAVPQAIFDFIVLAGLKTVTPTRPGFLLIVVVEHAVPALAVGRSFGHTGEFIPAVVVIIVKPVRQSGPDHLIDRIRNRVELCLTLEQLTLPQFKLLQMFARLMLPPPRLERGAHRTYQLLCVQRARQEHRVAQLVNPCRRVVAAAGGRAIGQHDKRDIRPRGLRGQRLLQGIDPDACQRLFGHQNRADLPPDEACKLPKGGDGCRCDILLVEQLPGDSRIPSAWRENTDRDQKRIIRGLWFG